MTIQDLVQWWNLIFALPFSAALLQILIQASGVFHLGHRHGAPHVGHHLPQAGHGIPHAGHFHPRLPHFGHGAHAPSHGQVAASRTPAGPPAIHAELHVEHEGTGSRLFDGFMGLLGAGRVPFMIVLSSFLMTWGLSGLIANQVLGPILKFPEIFVWPSMAASFVTATGLTGLLARGISKVMPSTETSICSQFDQIGRFARTVTHVDGSRGKVFLFDQHLHRIEMQVRTEDGRTIPSGTRVLITRYDRNLQQFIVREDPTLALEDNTTKTN